MQKNDLIRVRIDAWSSEGDGICRVDGQAVFVRGAVRGDLCEIRILKVMKTYAFARIENIIEPSPNRIDSVCPAFGKCGGCVFQQISYEEELRMKRERVQDALQRIGGLDVEVLEVLASGKQEHYRNKAIYQAEDQNGVPTFGFYRRGSHDVISTHRCAIEHPNADKIVAWVRDFLVQHQVQAYDEKTRQGTIRNLFVRTNARGQSQLGIVSAHKSVPHLNYLVESLMQQFPELVSIILLINSGEGNVVMTGRMSTLHGYKYLEDTLCGLQFRISPLSFYQINRDQTEKLYQVALDFAALQPHETALDLFCGIGTITLCLAQQAKHVIGAEIVSEAVQDAKRNAEINQINNVEFIYADATEAANQILQQNQSIDLITVDPPRKGLAPETIAAILKINPARIVYVSCDPATLARDLKLFSDNYQVTKIQPVDMFPRTQHVETCVLLSHKNPQTSPPSL